MAAEQSGTLRSLLRSLRRFGPRKRLSALLLVVAVGAVALVTRDLVVSIGVSVFGGLVAALGYTLVHLHRARSQLAKVKAKAEAQAELLAKVKEERARAQRRREAGRPNTERIARIEQDMSAGFATVGLEELRRVSEDPEVTPVERSDAFLAISRWHRSQGDPRRAYENMVFARMADPTGAHDRMRRFESRLLVDLGRHSHAREVLTALEAWEMNDPDDLLMLANTYAGSGGDEQLRLGLINQVFVRSGFAPLAKKDPSRPLAMDNLVTSVAPASYSGHRRKVSVIMPVYNGADTIGFALRSVLTQTWGDLEVIIVDDASQDATAEVVSAVAGADDRVRVIRQPTNRGAYAARNAGLRVASGELITVHDADDWSHAQKIETQVAALLANDALLGTMTSSFRPQSDLVTIEDILLNYSSLIVRRDVFDRVGIWDDVRVAADTEFVRRVRAVFGESSIIELMPEVPLSFYRQAGGSLTASPTTGLGSIRHAQGARRQYRDATRYWHERDRLPADLPYVPGASERPFPAPKLIGPDREVGAVESFDVVIMSDFALPASTTRSNIEEIRAQTHAGMKTALLHHPIYGQDSKSWVDSKIWDVVDGERVRFLSSGEEVSCDLLVVRSPWIAEHLIDGMPRVTAAEVAVVVNRAPMRVSGETPEAVYDLDMCLRNIGQLFGRAPRVYPIDPWIRRALSEHHDDGLMPGTLAEEDWLPIINTGVWRRSAKRPRREVVRIGRHAHDASDERWPADPETIRAAYPSEPGYEIHVLGGASVPAAHLGGLPDNWVIEPFEEASVREFLHDLDIYVDFPHRDWVETSGRCLLEAFAAGVPVITAPDFEPLFGDAAIYVDPTEVRATVDKLMGDESAYDRQVTRAFKAVEKRFSYEAHVRRVAAIRSELGQPCHKGGNENFAQGI